MFEIILNPNGASGHAGKVWSDVEPLFKASGKPYHVHISQTEDDIVKITGMLSKNPCDLVVVGGDGSFNQALNGINSFENVRMGLLPAGSGNDLIRGLGVVNSPIALAKIILEGKTVETLDLGEVIYHNRFDETYHESKEKDGLTHHRFIISSGIGFDAKICHDAESSRFKKILNRMHLGRLIYILTAVHTIATTKRTKAWVTVDGVTAYYEKLLLCVVMNTPFEGGGFMFCPKADGKDGILEGCLADGLSQVDFFRIFPYALKGHHLKFDGVYPFSANEVEIRTEEPMWVHTDGETTCRSSHITVKLTDQHVKMLM